MAFDWIESHRGLKDHPKTVTLSAVLRDRKSCVLGHLHQLWWWTLEYAPAGVIRPEFFPQVVSYCEWHGKPEQFWSGLEQAGFLESVTGSDGYVVHDWDEYAHRRVERHERESARKRAWRERSGRAPDAVPDAPAGHRNGQEETSGATGPTRARHRTGPTGEGVKPSPLPTNPLPPSAPDADAQGAAPTASAPAEPPPKWTEVAPGQHQGNPNGLGEVSLLTVRCPRCERSMPVAEVEEHDCQLVVGEPVEAPKRRGRPLRRLFAPSEAEPIPPEVQVELERMRTHRPTEEQIAAEVARVGQSRNGS